MTSVTNSKETHVNFWKSLTSSVSDKISRALEKTKCKLECFLKKENKEQTFSM